MSDRTLQRKLTEHDMTFAKLLEEHRFQRAVSALSTADVSVTDLAYELGYEYRPNFTRAFKKRTGLSPSEYRLKSI